MECMTTNLFNIHSGIEQPGKQSLQRQDFRLSGIDLPGFAENSVLLQSVFLLNAIWTLRPSTDNAHDICTSIP